MGEHKEERDVSLQALQVCPVCSREPECVPWNLNPDESHRLERIVEQPPTLNGGHHLFRVGDGFQALYAVRNGAFKTYAFDAGGKEYVLGFSLAGELIGFDGVYSRRHGCSAVALQDSEVCVLPYSGLAPLMGSIGRLREQILRLAGRDFRNHAFGDGFSAEARLARFLADLGERTTAAGGSGVEFDLPMSRDDIASYLRLDTDALLDAIATLDGSGVIEVDGSLLRVRDHSSLVHLAAG